MKKTILTYGFISGAIAALMLIMVAVTVTQIGFDKGQIIGYATIILSMSLVFFGIKAYRDRQGEISFGKAFTIGILISAISSLCYVITWLIVYYNVFPDFMEQYADHAIQKMEEKGATAAEIDAASKEMKQFSELYKNPCINAAITFIEPFPVGLLISLISAIVLKKKNVSTVGVE